MWASNMWNIVFTNYRIVINELAHSHVEVSSLHFHAISFFFFDKLIFLKAIKTRQYLLVILWPTGAYLRFFVIKKTMLILSLLRLCFFFVYAESFNVHSWWRLNLVLGLSLLKLCFITNYNSFYKNFIIFMGIGNRGFFPGSIENFWYIFRRDMSHAQVF